MGFFLFLVYLVASFVRPSELYAELAPFRPMLIIACAALPAAVLDWLRGRRPRLGAPQLYLALAFLLWAMFSVLAATSWLGGALEVFETLGTTLFLLLLLALNVDSLSRLRKTGAVLAMSGVYLAGQGILAYHFGHREEQFVMHYPRAAAEEEGALLPADDFAPVEGTAAPPGTVRRIRSLGLLNDPNDLAQALVAILPLALLFRGPHRPLRNLVLCWLPIAIMLYGIHLTRSRGGVLALLAIAFLGLRLRMGRVASLLLAVGGGLVLLAVGFMAGRPAGMDDSAAIRVAAWREGLRMVRASPLWGVGFGNFMEGADMVAHNSFIHCAAEVGLVGYFLWLAFLAVTLVESGLLEKELDPDDPQEAEMAKWSHATRVTIIGFLVAAFFLSRAYNMMLFLIVGLGGAIINIARDSEILVPRFHVLTWILRILVLEVGSLAMIYLATRFLR